MKIKFLVSVFVILLAASSCSAGEVKPTVDPTQGAQMLAGKYSTVITEADVTNFKSLDENFASNKGTWDISFTQDGKFTATRDRQYLADGVFIVKGTEIEIDVRNVCDNCPCNGAIGRYFWSLNDKQLGFSKKAGVCDAMDLALTAHGLTRQP